MNSFKLNNNNLRQIRI